MYIRTIMGSIYKVDNNKYGVIEENGIFKKYCENMGHSWYSELVATNQSENLEELCDEFVVEVKDKMPFVSDMFFINEKEQKEDIKALAEYYKGYENFYGAIWTSKGLIYVAKINDKGELELL